MGLTDPLHEGSDSVPCASFFCGLFNESWQQLEYCHVCDYRRGLDWWLDLLTTYALTTHDYTLQITDTHCLVSSVYYRLH
jgi:hypothetical protein